MKFVTIAASALLATTVSAGLFGASSVDVSEDFPVPGDNPLKHCKDPADDILDLISVDLSPNPPKAGKTLSITAKGTVKEEIEDGAKIHLSVKYGLITIVRMTRDLCEDVSNVDLDCPVQKGELTLTKDVELPNEIPPGTYTVAADVTTKDDKPILCLQAQVQFKVGGGDILKVDM